MRHFAPVLAALIGTLSLLPLVVSKLRYGFPYGKEKVRGVSLGGWFIIEDFTSHSVFDNTNDRRIVDEWTFGQYQDKKVARAALEKHWSTFITKDDFRQIQEAGLNHIRIPIGYWAFDLYPGDEFVQGQLPHLLKAVEWAKEYCLKIMLVLYGAPGSQNGFINSGHNLVPTVGHWQGNQTNIDRTTALVQRLVAMFKDQVDVVPIIGVLNEPHGAPGDSTLPSARQFYIDSYSNVRYPQGQNASETNLIIMTHDGFMGIHYWDGFLQPPEYQGVILDSHIYRMFTHDELAQTFDQHITIACKNASILATSPLWTIIGEWTATATDCGKGLNGRYTGAMYDGTYPGSVRVGSCDGLTGNASTFSEEYKTFLGQYWEAQVQAYERGGLGWIMWNWKMEDVDEWSYKKGLEHGWIPKDPTKGKWPDICEGKW